MVQKNLRQINGKRIEKKKIKPQWQPVGTSKSSKASKITLMLKQALFLKKIGKTKRSQKIIEKTEKIKGSI